MSWKFDSDKWEDDLDKSHKEKSKIDFSYISIFSVIIGSFIGVLKFRQSRIQKNIKLGTKENLQTMQKDWKKIWIVIFCIVSLIACLFYVPNLKKNIKGEVTGESFYSSVFEDKNGYKFQRSQVDYQAMLFREVIILFACYGGYTFSIMLKK